VEGAAGRDGVPQPPLSLTIADLAAMPRQSVPAKDRAGNQRVYEGVLLSDLLRKAGQPQGENLRGSLLSRYILATAHDGYHVLFSLPEADPEFNSAIILVADKVDGKLLPEKEGPLRLIIPAEKRESRWVRMLEKIEIASTPMPVH
jgi:hypothetical protein